MPRSVTETRWNRMTAEAVAALASQRAIVLLPVGSTEQHGPHLPTGVDDFLVTEVCHRAAQLLVPTTPVIVAPTLWCGLADHHVAFGGTFTVGLATYQAILRDLCRSIIAAGFARIVLVNGHYGNVLGLGAIVGELTRELGTPIATTTYFFEGSPETNAILEDQASLMHACEAETSMMMVVAPDLVVTERIAEAYGPPFDMAASLKHSLKRVMPFDQLTRSGVAGDARRASAAKGEALLGGYAAALATRLRNGEPWASDQP